MSSGLSLVKSIGSEVGHVALESGAEVLGGFGLGFVHARYKDEWYGEYAPEIAGGVGKIAVALLRGFGAEWTADVVGGLFASPGTVLSSAKYGIKFAEYLEERRGLSDVEKKRLEAQKKNKALGYVPPAGAGTMTISEPERQRFAGGR